MDPLLTENCKLFVLCLFFLYWTHEGAISMRMEGEALRFNEEQ